MAQNMIGKTAPYIGGILGGIVVAKNGELSLTFSGLTVITVALIIAITVIVVVFRVTGKVDVVALVKAWRSGEKGKKAPLSTREEVGLLQEAGSDEVENTPAESPKFRQSKRGHPANVARN